MKRKGVRILLLVVFLTVAAWICLSWESATADENVYRCPLSPFGAISTGCELRQTFSVEKEMTLTRIELELATYSRTNTSRYQFMLSVNGKTVWENDFTASRVKDNTYQSFSGRPLSISPEDTLEVRLFPLSDASLDNSITAWIWQTNQEEGLSRIVDETAEPMQGKVAMRVWAKSSLFTDLSRHFTEETPSALPVVLWIALVLSSAALLFILLNPAKEKQHETDGTDPLL